MTTALIVVLGSAFIAGFLLRHFFTIDQDKALQQDERRVRTRMGIDVIELADLLPQARVTFHQLLCGLATLACLVISIAFAFGVSGL